MSQEALGRISELEDMLQIREYVKRSSEYLCSLGINELDELLDGGVICGSIILVEGPPGAGKTTFAAKFIYEGAKRYGRKGAYLSFVEDKKSFYVFMESIGLNFKELEEKGLFIFIEGLPIPNEDAAKLILERLIMTIIEEGVNQVVVDSLTVLIRAFGIERTRELLTTMLREFKRLSVTAIIITEKPRSYVEAELGMEEYIADVVIELNYRIERGRIVRYMRILKARGRPIPLSELYFRIAKERVIEILKPVFYEDIPEIDIKIQYETGIPFIDRLVGGIPRGSQTLIIIEPGLNSLEPLLMLMVPLVARYGGPAIIHSYTISPKEIRRALSSYIKTLDLALNFQKVLEETIIVARNIHLMNIYELAVANAETDNKIKPKFIGIHDINTVVEVYCDIGSCLMLHMNNVLNRRRLGITAFYTYIADLKKDKVPGINMYDIVLSIEKVEVHGRLYYKMARLKHPILGLSPTYEIYGPLKYVRE